MDKRRCGKTKDNYLGRIRFSILMCVWIQALPMIHYVLVTSGKLVVRKIFGMYKALKAATITTSKSAFHNNNIKIFYLCVSVGKQTGTLLFPKEASWLPTF